MVGVKTAAAGRRTVKNLVKELKADRVKNANVIVDVMERLESSDTGTTLSAVTGLHHMFTYLLNEEAIQRPIKAQGEDSAKNKVNKWFIEMFEETLKAFLKLLNHKERVVQELSLSSLVKLMQSEGRHPIRKSANTHYGFPLRRLKAVIGVVISDSQDNSHLVSLLQEYLECQDFLFYTLLAVTEVVKTHTDMSVSVTYMNNLFPLVERIKIAPPDTPRPLLPPPLFLHPSKDDSVQEEEEAPPAAAPFTLPYPEARHALNLVWPTLLRYPLTPDLYRRVLVTLPHLALPHLDKPLALTGFFMESYNMGGSISLLALQGVFILINKHNLDYPEFYKKLYALLEPTIFHAKYKGRFFMLLDKFLASTHLPQYVTASFIKRLCRLSLRAPSCSLPLITKVVVNLLVRCPGLHSMVHNTTQAADQGEAGDPFLSEENDPACTRAGESSLWEMASLHHHCLPTLARGAHFTKKHSLPQREAEIHSLLDMDYDQLFERSRKVNIKEGISTTFSRPQGLFCYAEDKMSEAWCV